MKRGKRTGAKTRRAIGLSNMLGWLSIGLGVTEMLGARSMTNALGMRGQSSTMRGYGLREIATGVGILAGRDPTPWIWGRVAGDALDLATLAANYDEQPSHKRQRLMTAMISVAGVAAIDLLCARELAQPTTNRFVARYRHRSGLRGHGRRAETPPDYKTPHALAPYSRTRAVPMRSHAQYDL